MKALLLSSPSPSSAKQSPKFLLETEKLTLFHGRTPIIQGLTCRITRGVQVAIIGPNGAGKSTFLKAVANPRLPSSEFQGCIKRSFAFPREMAYLPQCSEAQRTFPLLVRDVVAGGLWHELGALQPLTKANHLRIEEALSVVGLQGFALHPIGALSGGQFQRVLFARLIVQDAALLLLDEPLTAVDAHTQKDLMTLIQLWHTQGRTQLVVLHDLDLVRKFFPYTLLLAREFSCFGPTAEVVTAKNLEQAVKSAQQWEGR